MFAKAGKLINGEAIGIILEETRYPKIPGNVGNASTYSFPVRIKYIKGLPPDWHSDEIGGSAERLHRFIETAKELEEEGVRAVTTGCGFFSVFQTETASALKIPVFTSPLMLVPLAYRMLGGKGQVGILTASARDLTRAYLEPAGVNDSIPIVIRGMDDSEEFNKAIMREEKDIVDIQKLEREVVSVAKTVVAENSEIEALVLECSDMPPFATAIQESVNLPVFDFICFINMVYQGVVQRRYTGFM